MKDALHSLGKLISTVDSIFHKIEARLSDERNRLTSVNNRILNCQHKVHQIKGSNKATTVYSTSKFPASKTLPSFYSTLTSEANDALSPYREAVDDVQYFPLLPKHSVVNNPELNNEVITILGRLNSYGTDMERIEFIIEEQGLGKLPEYIPSVGSLLLFNSDINLYNDYQTQDNLVTTGRFVCCVRSAIASLKD